jgi:TRAP-type transport system periplasmic protein
MKNILLILLVMAVSVSLILGGCTASNASVNSTPAPANTQTSSAAPAAPVSSNPAPAALPPSTPLPSVLPLLPPQPSAASDKYIFLTFSSGFPSEDKLEQVFREWFRKLQVNSGGRLQVSVLDTSGIPAKNMMAGGMGGFSTLAEERQYVDWAWCLPELFSGSLPLWQSLGSFVYGTDVKGSLKVCTQLYQEFPEIQAEFTKRDLKLVGTFAGYGNSIQTVEKPVRTLSDLNGFRLAGAGSLAPLLKQYGAVTDNMPMAGMGQEYTIFTTNKGKVDGTITLPEFLLTMKGGEVIKYSTYLHIPYSAMDIFCLKPATWNSIPPELQKIIEDSLPWFYERMTEVQLQLTQEAMDQAEARGVEFIELPREDLNAINSFCEQEALKKAAELDAKGLPGTKIFQRARQIVNEYNTESK